MSVPGRNQLVSLTKELLRGWDDTRQVWQDTKAEEFERTYLIDLESSVNRALYGIEKLDAMLTKIRRDCE